MSKKISVLMVGETHHYTTISSKGFDFFSESGYGDGSVFLRSALTTEEIECHHMPCHLAPTDFPTKLQELEQYDVVIFTDVGANSILLHPDVFHRSKAIPNRLHLVRDYVAKGGGFCMIGGYLSYTGIQAKGSYKGTVIEDILPVTLQAWDDRVETPQGVYPRCTSSHPLLEGLEENWPMLLGYNKLTVKQDADLLAEVDGDPLLVLGKWEKGRTAAFASDCAPHWASNDFCGWDGYPVLWQRIIKWLAKKL